MNIRALLDVAAMVNPQARLAKMALDMIISDPAPSSSLVETEDIALLRSLVPDDELTMLEADAPDDDLILNLFSDSDDS